MIEISIYIGLSVFIVILLYLLGKSHYSTKEATAYFIQSEMDRHILNQKLTELIEEQNKNELLNSDGFLKFVSDSRDWAFKYIEQTQKALVEFDKEVSPVLEWCKTYGLAIEDVHSEQIKKISLAYDKLKEVLPKDNETPNN